MKNNEIWKPITNYKGLYSISNYGRIRRDRKYGFGACKPNIILKPIKHYNGYLSVVLFKNYKNKGIRRLIHCLVLENFIGKTSKRYQVNHKDGNKTNNRVKNLEWVTPKENINHAKIILKSFSNMPNGEQIKQSKLTKNRILEIRNKYSSGKLNQTKLASLYNVSITNIHKIVRLKTWKHI